MDLENVINVMMENRYYTARELKYDTNANLYLSPYDYSRLLELMDNKSLDNEDICSLDLSTFNSYNVRLSFCNELNNAVNDYIRLILEDAMDKKSFLSLRNIDSITKSRILSEIEGTLNIESVPTTRKLINDIIYKNKKPINNNEQIILNMAKAIEEITGLENVTKEDF